MVLEWLLTVEDFTVEVTSPIVAFISTLKIYLKNLLKRYTVTLDGELYNHALKDNQKITSLVRKTVNIGEEELKESAELVQYPYI